MDGFLKKILPVDKNRHIMEIFPFVSLDLLCEEMPPAAVSGFSWPKWTSLRSIIFPGFAGKIPRWPLLLATLDRPQWWQGWQFTINKVFLYLLSQPILKTALCPHFKGKKTEAWKGHQLAHGHTVGNCRQNQDSNLALLPRILGTLATGGPLRGVARLPLGIGPAPIQDSESATEWTSGSWKHPLPAEQWTLWASLSSMCPFTKYSQQPNGRLAHWHGLRL